LDKDSLRSLRSRDVDVWRVWWWPRPLWWGVYAITCGSPQRQRALSLSYWLADCFASGANSLLCVVCCPVGLRALNPGSADDSIFPSFTLRQDGWLLFRVCKHWDQQV
jgi:hypothetical protein